MLRGIGLTDVRKALVAAAIVATSCIWAPHALAETIVEWVPIGAQAQQKISIENVSISFDAAGYPATGDAVAPVPLVTINAYKLYQTYGTGEFDCFHDIFGGRYYEFGSEEEFLAKYRGILATSNLIVGDGTDAGPFSYALANGRDYELTFENNVNPGAGVAHITGRGDFEGTKTVTFDIYPVKSLARRIYGEDRYKTMDKIVSEAFPNPGHGVAVLASGRNFPDALTASALAGTLDAPIVLSEPASLTPEAAGQITRLGIGKVYIMGGSSAISSEVEQELKGKGVTCVRISGQDRMQTALYALTATLEAGATPDTVIIATGLNYADSLSISPYSYKMRTPILLTGSDRKLSAAAIEALRAHPEIKHAIIVGGGAAVSEEVETVQLAGLGITPKRLFGEDRYATSCAIADFEVTSKAFAWKSPLLATGKSFPDALSGAPLAARTNSVLLLANKATDATVVALGTHRRQVGGSYRVLGGTAAVPGALTYHIDGLLEKTVGVSAQDGQVAAGTPAVEASAG